MVTKHLTHGKKRPELWVSEVVGGERETQMKGAKRCTLVVTRQVRPGVVMSVMLMVVSTAVWSI